MIVAVLITAAFAPLLILAAFALADYLGLRAADRILDWTMLALIGQWRIGCLVNIALGLGMLVSGIYFARDISQGSHWIAPIFMTLFGLWRVWRGLTAWPR